jgi:hypothetical protein
MTVAFRGHHRASLAFAELQLSYRAMKTPARSRNQGACVLAVSVVGVFAALAIPEEGRGTAFHLLWFSGAMGTVIGGIWFFMMAADAMRHARLKAGIGVLARWTISPSRWEAFRGESQGWDTRPGVRANSLDLEQTPPSTGIEIVVTGDGLLVGEEFHSLPKTVAIRSGPGWLEFHQVIVKHDGPDVHIVFRIPPGEPADRQVEQIKSAYARALAASPPIRISPRHLVLFLIVFVVLLALILFLVSRKA